MKYEIFKDNGEGITDLSMKFWQKHKHLIGKVTNVDASIDPIHEEAHKEWNVVITGTDGEIWLSGCNCGYGGTGPNGTRQILVELGLTPEVAENIMFQKKFNIEL